MKEIKFRGFSICTDKWVYGYLWRVVGVDLDYILTGKINISDYTIEKQEVHPESVGQYTGFKDRDGREIYGGDIVIVHHDKREGTSKSMYAIKSYISSLGISFNWECISGYHCITHIKEDDNSNCEVVGNIYENQELLKGNS